MDLNLYRKKIDRDRAMNGKAVSGQKFEVFAIHKNGYFTREPLCDSHLHETLLDACVCANIKSVGKDMEKYGVEVEIVQISGTTDFFKNKNLGVITKQQILRAFEKVTTPATLLYRAVNGYGSCLHTHSTITEAAICADAFVSDRGYSPCGTCSKEIGAAIFSQTPCFKHKQTAGVEEINGRELGTQEMHLGYSSKLCKASPSRCPTPTSSPSRFSLTFSLSPTSSKTRDEREGRSAGRNDIQNEAPALYINEPLHKKRHSQEWSAQ